MKTKHTAIALALMALTGGCLGEEPTPKFPVGSLVEPAVGGNLGQVIYISMVWPAYSTRRIPLYSVRFNSLSITTQTRLLTNDMPVAFSPMSIVSGMHEFELRAAKVKP